MLRPIAATVLTLAAIASAGCAVRPAVRVAIPPAPTVAAPVVDASGIWDWIFRSTDDQGDMRVEQEEWHLLQRGTRIEGYYDRAVTMMSTDERLFRCNQKLGFTKMTRVRIAGQVEGEHVQLREVAFQAKPGPCDDGARNLVEYSGVIHGQTLALRWGPEVGQTLVRRTDGNNAALGAQNGLEGTAETQGSDGPSSPAASLPVQGEWEWELRSIDAEGDERLEREAWHIDESADGIHGYYDRTVERVRGEGMFSCNGEARYTTSTRYTVVGQRFGDKLTLTEIDYKATPTHCDNALRRLDTYQGQLADPDTLILSWGPGNQLLRRRR
jgi:hypothetical protein